jgi:hypothetical protein
LTLSVQVQGQVLPLDRRFTLIGCPTTMTTGRCRLPLRRNLEQEKNIPVLLSLPPGQEVVTPFLLLLSQDTEIQPSCCHLPHPAENKLEGSRTFFRILSREVEVLMRVFDIG